MHVPNSASRNQTILLVEDHEDTLDLWLQYMRMMGYRAHGARTPGQALEIAGEHHIDLLVTDVQMPGINGWDLYQQLRTMHPRLCGIVVSGHGMPQHLTQSLLHGFDAHLVKPLYPDELLTAIDTVLEKIAANPNHCAKQRPIKGASPDKAVPA